MKLQQLFESQDAPIPVYRGMKVDKNVKVGDLLPIQIRQNRRPADTSIFSSALFNRGIELKFGIPEIRKRACFGSTNEKTASRYAFQVIDYGHGNHAATVQLMVPGSTDIVFHPRVEDSMDFMGAEFSSTDLLHKIYLEENQDAEDEFWTKINKIRTATYVSKSATDFWMHCIKLTIKDKSKYANILAELDKQALEFMDGYECHKAASFPQVGEVEVLIVGITQCQSKVLSLVDYDE